MTALSFLQSDDKPLVTFEITKADVIQCLINYDPDFDLSTLTHDDYIELAKNILDAMTDEFTSNADWAIQAYLDAHEESLLDSEDSKPDFEVER